MTLGPAPRRTRLFLAWIVVVASMALAAKPAAAQFQNPIQAAKDAYNKSKAQQQPQQKPGQPAPAQGQTQQAGSPQQRPGQQPAPGQNSVQTNDVGPFTPPPGTKIVPTAMAPMQQGAQFAVSPVGIHVATLSHNGSRPVIIYDGAVGPQFDQIFTEGGGYHPVIFSPDGNHWAYCGANEAQWTVMLDGKPQTQGNDAVNGMVSNNSCMLGFTSSGHLFYTATASISPSAQANRFVFDGKSTPRGASADMRDYAFSPDGNHAAYFISDPSNTNNPPPARLVIDGVPAPYVAGSPMWTADSKHLYTTRSIPNPPRIVTEVLLDGKPILRADNVRLYVAPAGDMMVAAVQKTAANPPSWLLVVDGKPVPGSEQVGGQIASVIFSADGKHYAAHYINQNGRHFIFADGKKGREYPGLGPIANASKDLGFALFTPVTDKLVYRSYDTQNGMSYLVIDGQESDPITSITDLVVSPAGDHVLTEGAGLGLLTMDGKTVQVPNVDMRGSGANFMSFTADGSHYAFVLRNSQGPVIYLDGVAQTGYSPINLGPLNNIATRPYVFSPDNKHIAYICRSTNPAAGNDIDVCVDNKAVRIGSANAYTSLTFSSDSNHLFWSRNETQGAIRVFADGKPIIDGFPTSTAGFVSATWQPDANGNLLVLLQGDTALERVSITPAPNSSIATMMGGATAMPSAR